MPNPYTNTRTHSYLRGHANKIALDLEKMFRLYTGVYVRLFNLDRTGDRCTECTDSFTGTVLNTNCPICRGTGFTLNYSSLGDFWAWVTLPPYLNTTDELGNTDNQGSKRTAFALVKAPLLKDDAIIITIDTKDVYRIVDDQIEITAVNGIVILQTAQVSKVTPGDRLYGLIDW